LQERLCNKYGCGTPMTATREFDKYAYSNEAYRQRKYRCPVCGNETFWLAKPSLDGTFAALHNLDIPGGGHSGSSMMADPRIYPPRPPQSTTLKDLFE